MKPRKQACLLVRITRLRDSRDWYPLQTPDNDVECLQKLVPVLTFTVVAARLEFSLTSLVLSLEVNKTTKKPACLVAKKPESAKSSVLKIFPCQNALLCAFIGTKPWYWRFLPNILNIHPLIGNMYVMCSLYKSHLFIYLFIYCYSIYGECV